MTDVEKFLVNDFDYVIKRRHIQADPGDSTSDAVYLGADGRWYANIAQARKFTSLPAVDVALQETWVRLRNAGERSIILFIVKHPSHDDEQVPDTSAN